MYQQKISTNKKSRKNLCAKKIIKTNLLTTISQWMNSKDASIPSSAFRRKKKKKKKQQQLQQQPLEEQNKNHNIFCNHHGQDHVQDTRLDIHVKAQHQAMAKETNFETTQTHPSTTVINPEAHIVRLDGNNESIRIPETFQDNPKNYPQDKEFKRSDFLNTLQQEDTRSLTTTRTPVFSTLCHVTDLTINTPVFTPIKQLDTPVRPHTHVSLFQHTKTTLSYARRTESCDPSPCNARDGIG